jgi:hypothetical protein
MCRKSITPLPQDFFDSIENLSMKTILRQFVGDEIPGETKLFLKRSALISQW